MTPNKSYTLFVLIFIVMASNIYSEPFLSTNTVFQYTEENQAHPRLPGIIQTDNGTIMLVCQKRIESMKDFGVPTDLQIAFSSDDGQSWTTKDLLHVDGYALGLGAIIYDKVIDRTFVTYGLLPLTMKDEWKDPLTEKAPWYIYSDDEGKTWSKPEQMKVELPPGKNYASTGNGNHGIQLESGRLICPSILTADDIDPVTKEINRVLCAGMLISDDHGKTWRVGAYEAATYSNEPCVVKTFEGDNVLLLWRNQDPKNHPGRGWSLSKDNGEMFSKSGFHYNISYTEVHGGVAAYTQGDPKPRKLILQSSPAGPHRHNMAIRISNNNGKIFQETKIIFPGPAAYSDLLVTKDNTILCVYTANWYKSMNVTRLNYEWLQLP